MRCTGSPSGSHVWRLARRAWDSPRFPCVCVGRSRISGVDVGPLPRAGEEVWWARVGLVPPPHRRDFLVCEPGELGGQLYRDGTQPKEGGPELGPGSDPPATRPAPRPGASSASPQASAWTWTSTHRPRPCGAPARTRCSSRTPAAPRASIPPGRPGRSWNGGTASSEGVRSGSGGSAPWHFLARAPCAAVVAAPARRTPQMPAAARKSGRGVVQRMHLRSVRAEVLVH